MIFHWWRRRRRARLLARPFPPEWLPHLEELRFYRKASEEDRSRLRDLVRVFVEEIHWESCGGLELTDRMRVQVAAQACRLILRLSQDDYRKVKTILIYPTPFRVEGSEDEFGIVADQDHYNAGEAWLGGPVVLAWNEVRKGFLDPSDGKNLVYHEFAHKLDMIDGYADGTPPALSSAMQRDWTRVVGEGFARHQAEVEAGRRTFLDPYAATNPAEYFAVASEVFFERPHRLRREHEELFDFLVQVYRQDPTEAASEADGADEGDGGT